MHVSIVNKVLTLTSYDGYNDQQYDLNDDLSFEYYNGHTIGFNSYVNHRTEFDFKEYLETQEDGAILLREGECDWNSEKKFFQIYFPDGFYANDRRRL